MGRCRERGVLVWRALTQNSRGVAAADVRQFMMEMAVAAVVEYPEAGVFLDVIDVQPGDRPRS